VNEIVQLKKIKIKNKKKKNVKKNQPTCRATLLLIFSISSGGRSELRLGKYLCVLVFYEKKV